MKNEENNKKENKKLTLKEKLKDKRERAKIELIMYGIFFLFIIIFARVLGSTSNNIEDTNSISQSFISEVEDNYEYHTVVTINENTYEYYGKVLGNNATINLIEDGKTTSYYLMNKKYYILEGENYILSDKEEVYPYIDYHYLNIDNIKEYINLSVKENDTYKVKLSSIILNSQSEEYLTIYINEGDKNIVIDYTPLFKLTEENTNKVIVNITYNNIDNIISLEE